MSNTCYSQRKKNWWFLFFSRWKKIEREKKIKWGPKLRVAKPTEFFAGIGISALESKIFWAWSAIPIIVLFGIRIIWKSIVIWGLRVRRLGPLKYYVSTIWAFLKPPCLRVVSENRLPLMKRKIFRDHSSLICLRNTLMVPFWISEKRDRNRYRHRHRHRHRRLQGNCFLIVNVIVSTIGIALSLSLSSSVP